MRQGYGDEHIHCYQTVTAFYQMRQPLVILICGAPFTGVCVRACVVGRGDGGEGRVGASWAWPCCVVIQAGRPGQQAARSAMLTGGSGNADTCVRLDSTRTVAHEWQDAAPRPQPLLDGLDK